MFQIILGTENTCFLSVINLSLFLFVISLNICMKREWLILIESLKDFIKEIMLKLSLDFCVLQLAGRLRNGMGKDETVEGAELQGTEA